jgi:hypothetical protein
MASLVADQFKPAFKQYRNRLGSPITTPIRFSQGGYQAKYQYATILRSAEPHKLFVLHLKAGQPSEWTQQFEDSVPDEHKWYDEDELSKMPQFIGVPKDLHPPFASVAYLWTKSPAYWKDLVGWMEWHCSLRVAPPWIQEFEHGTIVGPFRFYRAVEGKGKVYILWSNGQWNSWDAPEIAQPCQIPSDRDPRL